MGLQALKRNVRFILLSVIWVLFAFMVYAVATGFPPQLFGHTIKIKNLSGTSLIILALFVLRAGLSSLGPVQGIACFFDRIRQFASRRRSLWFLFFAASALFVWQQITEFLAAEINFLPFSIYDYMIYYFHNGIPTFTGLLHEFYHVNLILFIFAPFWKLYQSPLWILLSYGVITAAAIFPLYHIALLRLSRPAVALLICFVYLNFKYIQNLLQANFSVEVFYPLFIFTSVFAALKGRWRLYYLFILLTLLIKEDAALYCGAIALLLFFLNRPKRGFPDDYHKHSVATVVIAGLYVIFMLKVFVPLTGSNIFQGDTENFLDHGNTGSEVIMKFVKAPFELLYILFGSEVKLRTYFKLISRLAFLPLFSPSILLVLIPIAPLFMHVSGENRHFVELRLYYGATVLPFLFTACILGFSNICQKLKEAHRTKFIWVVSILLVVLNIGHYRTEKITRQVLESISWARQLPSDANVVTNGHLLPYIGYRKFNYYLADPWELTYHEFYPFYANADYYLIARNVNLYPWDLGRVEKKIQDLKRDARYEIIRSDENRILFKRKGYQP